MIQRWLRICRIINLSDNLRMRYKFWTNSEPLRDFILKGLSLTAKELCRTYRERVYVSKYYTTITFMSIYLMID